MQWWCPIPADFILIDIRLRHEHYGPLLATVQLVCRNVKFVQPTKHCHKTTLYNSENGGKNKRVV